MSMLQNARAKMQEENKKRQFQDNSSIPAIHKKEIIEKGSILFPLQFQ